MCAASSDGAQWGLNDHNELKLLRAMSLDALGTDMPEVGASDAVPGEDDVRNALQRTLNGLPFGAFHTS